MLVQQSKPDTLIKVLVSAILIYLAGQMVIPLVSPVNYSGAIWPPVGVALGAVLLWGNRILPGVFFGELALKLAVADIAGLEITPGSLAIIILMAMNAMFRAWLGAYLVQRYANYPNPLFELEDILRFFLFSSLIATFVASLFNISALYALELVQKDAILLAIFNWWLGDCMGVVIFTPLFMLLFAYHDEHWQRRKISLGIPLIVLLIISVISFHFIKKQENHRIHEVFSAFSEQFQTTFESQHLAHLEQLRFVKHFFETDEHVTEKEFSQFTQTLFTSGFLQSLQWVIYTGKKEEEYSFSAEYQVNAADTRLQLEPVIFNPDLLVRFVDTNSETVYLVNKSKQANNVLISAFVPVYKAQSLIGVLHANIALGAMINHHLETAPMKDVLIQVRENNLAGPLLFQSEQLQVANNLITPTLVHRFLVIPQLHFSFISSNNFIQRQYSIIVWWTSVAIMLVVSLLTSILLMLSGYTEVIKRKVKERTEALRISNTKLAESEAQFKELVQVQSAIVWRYDPFKQLFSFVSDEAEKLLGYPRSRWLTEVGFWESCIDERDREWAVRYCMNNTEGHKEHDFDYRMTKADGSIIWIRDIVNFKYEDGEIIELLGFMIDITQQKQTEEQLHLAATTFDGLDGIIITDAEAKILKVNHAFEEITGYTSQQVIGKNPSLLSSGKNSVEFFHNLWGTLGNAGRFEGEILNRRQNGEIFPVWQRITAVTDERNEVTHYVSIFTDITEQKESELKIHNMAFYDSLTSLPNRRLLIDRLEKEVIIAKRHGKSGALIFLDLDHFKILNDSLGHHIGDELLVQVAERIQQVIRREDSAIRLGGDEFVILIHANADNLKQAADHGLLVAEKIQRAVNKKYILQSYHHHISSSLGITLFPEENQTTNMILQQADTAMYQSKDLGRNRISYFHPSMQAAADAKLQLEKELRLAIEQEQFVLCYQPQVDTEGELISAEALVRWIHPEKGLVSPADFIPIAEETSLILPLGAWIITEVCRQIKVWQLQGLAVKNVAINVSSKQFRQHDFVKTVQQSIDESGISPKLIEIELTEGVLIDDIKDTVQKMQALKDLGVSIAIDDFGTGYSSLAYLKQLPLDVLKIDQSFVRDITLDQSDAVIVETIIDMSHNLGLHTIAEGVETEDQYVFLSDKGCKMFQGYYFSKPLKAEDFYKKFIN